MLLMIILEAASSISLHLNNLSITNQIFPLKFIPILHNHLELLKNETVG